MDERPTPYAELARLSDAELVAHARRWLPDGGAPTETARTCVALLFERRRALVRAVCARKAPIDVVDDLEAQVYLRFVRAVYTQTAPMENPSGLLVKMARNVIASHFQQSEGDAIPIGEIPDVPVTDDELDDIGIDEAVEELLAHLTPRQREVVWARVMEGQSSAEIAARLDTTAGNVDVIFFRAIRRLREVITR